MTWDEYGVRRTKGIVCYGAMELREQDRLQHLLRHWTTFSARRSIVVATFSHHNGLCIQIQKTGGQDALVGCHDWYHSRNWLDVVLLSLTYRDTKWLIGWLDRSLTRANLGHYGLDEFLKLWSKQVVDDDVLGILNYKLQ